MISSVMERCLAVPQNSEEVIMTQGLRKGHEVNTDERYMRLHITDGGNSMGKGPEAGQGRMHICKTARSLLCLGPEWM